MLKLEIKQRSKITIVKENKNTTENSWRDLLSLDPNWKWPYTVDVKIQVNKISSNSYENNEMVYTCIKDFRSTLISLFYVIKILKHIFSMY